MKIKPKYLMLSAQEKEYYWLILLLKVRED